MIIGAWKSLGKLRAARRAWDAVDIEYWSRQSEAQMQELATIAARVASYNTGLFMGLFLGCFAAIVLILVVAAKVAFGPVGQETGVVSFLLGVALVLVVFSSSCAEDVLSAWVIDIKGLERDLKRVDEDNGMLWTFYGEVTVPPRSIAYLVDLMLHGKTFRGVNKKVMRKIEKQEEDERLEFAGLMNDLRWSGRSESGSRKFPN